MFKFVKVKEVASPERGTSQSAGIDFFIPNDAFGSYGLGPGESLKIPSGIKMIIPEGYCLQFVNKSGWGSKGLFVGACLVDSDYRGEVHLDIHNFSDTAINLTAGMKIVQAILLPVPNVNPMEIDPEEFSVYENTERGAGGFGSTGLKWTGTGYKITKYQVEQD